MMRPALNGDRNFMEVGVGRKFTYFKPKYDCFLREIEDKVICYE